LVQAPYALMKAIGWGFHAKEKSHFKGAKLGLTTSKGSKEGGR